MKKFLLWMIALAAASGVMFAQDVTGTWQGTLQAGGRDLRIVIKIANESGGLRALLYSIDQQAPALPGAITVQGVNVKIAVGAIGGTFEGKLNSDSTAMNGTWTQGPAPLPFNLVKATAATAWAIPEPPPPPKPMAANANPVFEVATIKPANPEARGRSIRVNGRQFATTNTSLSDLMTFCYGVHARQLVGAPSWVETDRFDLNARPDGEGQPNEKQWKAMLEKLLAERFKLTFHREKKELNVFALVATKTGHKLTKSEGDPNGLPALFFQRLGVLPARNATMTDLAGLMQSAVLDRPVVDQTGITGRWDFTLSWSPDEFQFTNFGPRPPAPAGAPDAPPDLYTAIQQQLGLKLEATKAPAEVLVIDKVEKPSEN